MCSVVCLSHRGWGRLTNWRRRFAGDFKIGIALRFGIRALRCFGRWKVVCSTLRTTATVQGTSAFCHVNAISGTHASGIRRRCVMSGTDKVLEANSKFQMVISMYVRERGTNSHGAPQDHILQIARLSFARGHYLPNTLAPSSKIVQWLEVPAVVGFILVRNGPYEPCLIGIN